MTNTILLTGATGFVGRQILSALDSLDVRIILAVRDANKIDHPQSKKIIKIVFTSDFFNETSDWYRDLCIGVDIVIHAAWYVEHGEYLNSPLNMECLKGTLNFAKACSKAEVSHFIGIGSCLEYQASKDRLGVNSPLHPTTLYGSCKIGLFYALSQFFLVEKISFSWCRLFYIYGDGEDSRRLVPYLHSKLRAGEFAFLRDGDKIRDFLDVVQVGKKVVKVAMDHICGPINICSGTPTSIRSLAESIADLYGRRDLLEFATVEGGAVTPDFIVGEP